MRRGLLALLLLALLPAASAAAAPRPASLFAEALPLAATINYDKLCPVDAKASGCTFIESREIWVSRAGRYGHAVLAHELGWLVAAYDLDTSDRREILRAGGWSHWGGSYMADTFATCALTKQQRRGWYNDYRPKVCRAFAIGMRN